MPQGGRSITKKFFPYFFKTRYPALDAGRLISSLYDTKMISVESLSKRYGEIKAVNDLTFEIKKGEVVGFLGPNGAGKTTTMQIITGFIKPSEGRALIDGVDVTVSPITVKERIGYLPENTPLYDDLSVFDFLSFVASVRKLNGKRDQAIKETSERCGITEVLDRPIGTLSKGYRQRVGLAQAILHDPPILILDEPTSGLDPIQIGEIRELIRELGREKTVLLSTHILPEVEQTCNRVIVINRGSIVADSQIENLKAELSGGSIRVQYKGSTPPDKFRSFGRIEDVVEDEGVWSFRITPKEPTMDIREEIFIFCKERDIVLLEMYREKRSLEEIFKELTLEGDSR